MVKEFRLPDLGEGIHEGEVLAVKVRAGQQVKEDDVILEVETDKAAVELPSPFTDVVTDVRVGPGDVVHVGDVLMVFGGPGDGASVGDAELATGHPSPVPTAGAQQRVGGPAVEKLVEPPAVTRGEGPVPAAPSTRRLARELGVDLHSVTPTGPGGRVTSDDVRAYAGQRRGEHVADAVVKGSEPVDRSEGTGAQATAGAPSPVAYDGADEVERVPLRSVRRATARHMALAWSQIPHVTTQDLVDITELESLRQRYKDEVRDRGGALTLTAFVVKALAHALKEFPKFNASLDTEADEIVLKKAYHIGVAVDTERGLLVPTLRHVDRKSVVELALELKALADRAREGRATVEELQGSTMTITNVGAIGGTGFTPIINYPEVAILGLAQARVQPVAVAADPGAGTEVLGKGYEFVPRLMMPIVLAFDHRVNDGAEAQRFLNAVIAQLENPERLLMGL